MEWSVQSIEFLYTFELDVAMMKAFKIRSEDCCCNIKVEVI